MLALALYVAIAILLLGRVLLVRGLTNFHLGPAVDSSFLMWALAWWPYALRHGLNPFICRLIWAPEGFNLAWSGGIPLASLVAAPLTVSAGPVASYNVLCLVAPALAAWCAFILCYRLSGGYYSALLGGCLFGFSPYMLGQLAGGHLNLLLLFPAPLIVMIMIAGFRQTIGQARFVTALAAAFIAQFLCSIELAATTVIFGVFALLLSRWVVDPGGRVRWSALLTPLAVTGGVCLVVLAPYLYYLFLPGAPRGAINSPGAYSADLANLVIPTQTTELGMLPVFHAVAYRFPGNLGERDAYLGLPLLLLIFHFGWTRRREQSARLLSALFAIIVICALGPRLRIAGWTGFGMPWKLAMHVPLIKSALPGRFMGYAFLVAAIVASLWLADPAISRRVRMAVGILLVAASLPNVDARTWAAPTNIPSFFSAGSARQRLHPAETVVVLPYGISGNSMLWQAVAGMSFRMAGGYTGITPREFERWPVVRAFMTGTYIPDLMSQLLAMMAAHDSDAVLVDNAHRAWWAPALASIDAAPVNCGGVWIYRASPTVLAQYSGGSALEWERRDAAARFDSELAAARAYLRAGYDPAGLSPMRAQQMGLLPAGWVKDRDVRTDNGLYLGPWAGGRVAVGIVGSYEAVQPLIAKYRPYAAKIFFPYPSELIGQPTGDTFMRLLVVVFDRTTLLRTRPAATAGRASLRGVAAESRP